MILEIRGLDKLFLWNRVIFLEIEILCLMRRKPLYKVAKEEPDTKLSLQNY